MLVNGAELALSSAKVSPAEPTPEHETNTDSSSVTVRKLAVRRPHILENYAERMLVQALKYAYCV